MLTKNQGMEAEKIAKLYSSPLLMSLLGVSSLAQAEIWSDVAVV